MKRLVTAIALCALMVPRPASGIEFLDRCFQDLCNCLCAPFTAKRYEPATMAVAPVVVPGPPPVYQVPAAPLAVAPAPVIAAPPTMVAPAPAPVYAAPAPTCAAEMSCMAEMTCCEMPQAQGPVGWVTYEVPQPSWWQRFCECLCPPRTPAAAPAPAPAAACGSNPMAGGYAFDYAPPASTYANAPVPNGFEPGMVDFQVVSDEVVGQSQVADGAPQRPAELGLGDPSPRGLAEGEAELLPPPKETRGIPVSH